MSVMGGKLESPRKIATTVFSLATDKDIDETVTLMHALWGQFIDHDISQTPQTAPVLSTACPILVIVTVYRGATYLKTDPDTFQF